MVQFPFDHVVHVVVGVEVVVGNHIRIPSVVEVGVVAHSHENEAVVVAVVVEDDDHVRTHTRVLQLVPG